MDPINDAIPIDQFVPDAPEAASAAPSGAIPVGQFKADDASTHPGAIPVEQFQSDEDKYGSAGQMLLTAAESAAKGVAGPLATGAEQLLSKAGVPGLTNQDIVNRANTNPLIAGGSELAGNVALMAALPEMEIGQLAKIGSKAINGMIQNAGIAAGDEVSQAMLGQGNPMPAVAAHIAGSGAIGLIGGAGIGKAEQLGSKALQSIENAKIGKRLPGVLYGAGHAATFPGEEIVPLAKSALLPEEAASITDKDFRLGQKLYNSYLTKVPKYVGKVALPLIGADINGVTGGLAGYGVEKVLEDISPKLSQKYVGPAILKAAGSDSVENIGDIIDHATKISKGTAKISKGVESIFKGAGNKFIEHETSPQEREKLRKYIEEGGSDQEVRDAVQNQAQQGFAEGGPVQQMQIPQNGVAKVYPDQNMMLSAAKARVSNYLNAARPLQNHGSLPYDTEFKNKQHDTEYNKVLDLANNPLSILNRIKSGKLVPKDMQHFTNLYPELHQDLSNRLTKRIMEGKVKGEKKPPYKVRQAMSLFLGSSLDSSLTPTSIMAVQNSFAQQNAKKQAAMNSKSALNKVGEQAMTPNQSREERLNKS